MKALQYILAETNTFLQGWYQRNLILLWNQCILAETNIPYAWANIVRLNESYVWFYERSYTFNGALTQGVLQSLYFSMYIK